MKYETMVADTLAAMLRQEGMPLHQSEQLGKALAEPVVAAIEIAATHLKHIPGDPIVEGVWAGVQELANRAS